VQTQFLKRRGEFEVTWAKVKELSNLKHLT